MITQAVVDALNDQIQQEFAASYLYLSMSAHMETKGLSGFAKWLRLQSHEETNHGLRLFDYVLARGGRVQLKAMPAPADDFGAPLALMQNVLDHERKVTQLINHLYETAAQERDYVTAAELQWFLTEQVEEEKTAADLVQRLELAGGDANALLLVDREMGARTSAD